MTPGRPALKSALVYGGALLAAGSLAAAAGAPIAAAKAPSRPAIEILAPKRGAVHVSSSRPLRVRLRVAPGVRNLRVVVSGRRERVVTKRFARAAGGVRTATLRLGRELSAGAGAVRAGGSRGGQHVAASAHFFVASRRAQLVRVSGLPARAAHGPLAVRLKTAHRVDAVRVRVNGGNAAGAFSHTSSGIWRGTLSPDEGLHFGRNRIVVTAYDRDGAFDSVTRVVNVRTGRPLVGAGKARLTRVRRPVRLDGRSTLPRDDRKLRLTWKIVGRPKGSKAQLHNPHAIRPRLRPDVPGQYRIRLTAAPRIPRGKAAAADVAAAASDVTTVGAQPAILPQGLSVGTIGSDSAPGLRVGDAWYAIGNGAVQLLVLDGETLEVDQNTTFSGDDSGLNALASDVDGIDESKIVMIENPSSRPLSASKSTVATLNAMFANLGITAGDRTIGNWASSGLPAGGWSVISSPRAVAGTGAGLFGMQEDTSRVVGEMDGYLQSTDTGSQQEPGDTYLFTWPSTDTTFSTQAAGDNGTYNEMTVAGQTYRSDTIAAGSSAFHLVWLDAGTLAVRGQATIAGDRGNQLANTLTSIDAQASPTVLLMTTIGHPAIPRGPDGATNGWATVAAKIAAFGGNSSAFLSLNGTGNGQYSLVGATGIGDEVPNAGTDVSTILRPSVPLANLVGLLERGPAGAWNVDTGNAVSASAKVDALQPDIKQVLAQPAQPFTPFTGPGQRAAEAQIAVALHLADDPTYGIRVNYWNTGITATQWSNHLDDLNTDLGECATTRCSAGYVAVATQLASEFEDVSDVRDYFGDNGSGTLYGALETEFEGGAYTFDSVSDYILKLYPPQLPVAHGTSPFDVIEGMLDGASSLAPEGGEVLGLAAAAMEMGSIFSDPDDGGGYLGATKFDAAASQFASSLTTQFSTSLRGLTRVANLLLSDAGRLRAAGAKLETSVTNGGWQMSDSSFVGDTLNRSMAAYTWASLLPTTFKTYQCVPPPLYYPPVRSRGSVQWYDAGMKPHLLDYSPFTTVTHHPNPERWGPLDTNGSQIGDGFVTIARYWDGEHQYLDGTVATDLFGPISAEHPEQLGQLPAYLLAPQPTKNSPGFQVDQGSFDPDTSHGYVSYSCAGNHWREDTNEGAW